MIKGKLTELRPVTKDDLKDQFRWRNDETLANLAAGTDSAFWNNHPLETLEAMYEKNLTSIDKREGCVFSVFTLEDGKHIGRCSYREVNMVSRSAVIGIYIGEKDYWGRGYGTDIVKTLIRHLFNSLNLERIQLDTWSGNERAVRCYEKCGFQIEGRLRNNEYVDGSFYDTIVLGLLREEFIG